MPFKQFEGQVRLVWCSLDGDSWQVVTSPRSSQHHRERAETVSLDHQSPMRTSPTRTVMLDINSGSTRTKRLLLSSQSVNWRGYVIDQESLTARARGFRSPSLAIWISRLGGVMSMRPHAFRMEGARLGVGSGHSLSLIPLHRNL